MREVHILNLSYRFSDPDEQKIKKHTDHTINELPEVIENAVLEGIAGGAGEKQTSKPKNTQDFLKSLLAKEEETSPSKPDSSDELSQRVRLQIDAENAGFFTVDDDITVQKVVGALDGLSKSAKPNDIEMQKAERLVEDVITAIFPALVV